MGQIDDTTDGAATVRQPRYVQVANDLRAMIVADDFVDGATLPTESVLCARYGVSRFTVREALRRLQAEGMIRRRRGSGTVVASGGNALRQSLSDVAELLQYAAGSTFDFEVHGMTTLSAARAAVIGVPVESRWVCLSGVRRIDGVALPIAMVEVFVHADLEPQVKALRNGPETLFSQLARLGGFEVARVIQDISAVGAGGREAELLMVRRRTPCLRIVRSYIDQNGRTALVSNNVHAGDRFTYSTRIEGRIEN